MPFGREGKAATPASGAGVRCSFGQHVVADTPEMQLLSLELRSGHQLDQTAASAAVMLTVCAVWHPTVGGVGDSCRRVSSAALSASLELIGVFIFVVEIGEL